MWCQLLNHIDLCMFFFFQSGDANKTNVLIKIIHTTNIHQISVKHHERDPITFNQGY